MSVVILSHINHLFPVSLCVAVSAAVSTTGCTGVCAGPCGARLYKGIEAGTLGDSADTSQERFISVDQEAEGITCVWCELP